MNQAQRWGIWFGMVIIAAIVGIPIYLLLNIIIPQELARNIGLGIGVVFGFVVGIRTVMDMQD